MGIEKIFNSDWNMKIVFTIIAVALCVVAVKMISGIYIHGDVDVGDYFHVSGDIGVDSNSNIDVNVTNSVDFMN